MPADKASSPLTDDTGGTDPPSSGNCDAILGDFAEFLRKACELSEKCELCEMCELCAQRNMDPENASKALGPFCCVRTMRQSRHC